MVYRISGLSRLLKKPRNDPDQMIVGDALDATGLPCGASRWLLFGGPAIGGGAGSSEREPPRGKPVASLAHDSALCSQGA
jgi:hypothetical protein